MQGVGGNGRLGRESMAFAATIVILLMLFLISMLFFGTVFVAPIG